MAVTEIPMEIKEVNRADLEVEWAAEVAAVEVEAAAEWDSEEMDVVAAAAVCRT